MTWFKVDDAFYRSKKVRKLGRDRVACVGLWALAGAWAADNLTDGFVPWEIIEDWDGARRLSARLIDADLWDETESDGEQGIAFHDWADWQPTKAQVLAERLYNARKSALYRDPELIAAVRKRDRDRCRYCGIKVNWRDRRSTSGGTYDHVEADGLNTLENLVVACRSCNSSKGNRPLSETGKTLLEPGAMSRRPRSAPTSNQDPTGSYLDTDQIGSRSFQDPDPTRPVNYIKEDPPTANAVGPPKGKTARASRIPDDFAVTPAMVTWAQENTPHVDGRLETEKFRDYWAAAAGANARKVDWPAAWRYWMRKAAERPTPSRGLVALNGGNPAPRPSTTDQRVAAGLALAAKYEAEERRS